MQVNCLVLVIISVERKCYELLPYKWGSFCEHPACRILFENIHSDLRPVCRAGRLRHRYLVWRQDY